MSGVRLASCNIGLYESLVRQERKMWAKSSRSWHMDKTLLTIGTKNVDPAGQRSFKLQGWAYDKNRFHNWLKYTVRMLRGKADTFQSKVKLKEV